MTDPSCENCRKLSEHYEARMVELSETITGQDLLLRKAGRDVVRAVNALAQAREEDPTSEEIRELFDLWRNEWREGKAVKFKVSGPRGQDIKKAIGWKGKEMCAEAIVGAKFDQYVRSNKHAQDISMILKDEARIEKYSGMHRDRVNVVQFPTRPSELPDAHVQSAWLQALMHHDSLLRALESTYGWSKALLGANGVLWDQEAKRLAFPVHDVIDGLPQLVNMVRFSAKPPELSPVPGRPQRLWPMPSDAGETMWLVEDPPAALSGRAIGVKAYAVPPESEPFDQWSGPLYLERVVVCLRSSMRKRAGALAKQVGVTAREVRLVQLPGEDTGLVEWHQRRNGLRALEELAGAATPLRRLEAA